MMSLKEKYRCIVSFCVDFGGEYFIPFPFPGCLQTAVITPMQHALELWQRRENQSFYWTRTVPSLIVLFPCCGD